MIIYERYLMEFKKIFLLSILLIFSSKMKANPFDGIYLAVYGVLTTTYIIYEVMKNQGLEARLDKLEPEIQTLENDQRDLKTKLGLLDKRYGKMKKTEED